MIDIWRAAKESAKERLSEDFLNAALIVFIPGIIASVLNRVLSNIFTTMGTTGTVLDLIITLTISMIAGFISLKMLLNYTFNFGRFTFDHIFDDWGKIGRYVVSQLIKTIALLLPFLPFVLLVVDLYKDLIIFSDTDAMVNYLESYLTATPEFMSSLWMGLLGMVVISFVLVKFQFTEYLIVDSNYSVLEAYKRSWTMTNGHYFTVLLFGFYFIHWMLLGIVTCGLGFIYVSPLLAVANVCLYDEISMQTGGKSKRSPAKKATEDTSIFEKDPLEYYEN